MTLNQLYEYALSFHGILYEYGGDYVGSSYGIDCSGLLQKIGARGGIKFDRDNTADSLYHLFKKDCPSELFKDSFAFFGSVDRISHCGWMIDDRCMISAAGGGSWCKSRDMAEQHNAKVKIQSISIYNVPPLVGAWMPPYPFFSRN